MTGPTVHIRGMPYVAGTACGRLQRGLADNPAGRIVLLEQVPSVPFEQPPAGFVMIDGAPLSHSMIPLLGSGIPGILITRAQAGQLQAGMDVRLDASTGLLTTDPGVAPPPAAIPAAKEGACRTRDGVDVSLRASARDRHAVQAAVAAGADSIGLVRSEFLQPADGQAGDTAFYRRAFRQLCESAAGKPVTIRLFDIAVSKHPAWLQLEPADAGILGRQGVRLFHDEPVRSIYHAQLEAIAGLATTFELRVLLPYVADLPELQYWHEDVMQRLDGRVRVGAMAETPAAALQLREWLQVADFVAIGCNDLMQCLFGADRDHPGLHRYLDPHAPALYRFLRQVADGAHEHLDAIQLCGVLPQLPGILPLLLGLGYRVCTVEPALLPYLRDMIAVTDTGAARLLAGQACQAGTSAGVRELLGQPSG